MNKKIIYCFLPMLSGLPAAIFIVIISIVAVFSIRNMEVNTDFIYSWNVESTHKILDIMENMERINEIIYLSSHVESVNDALAVNQDSLFEYQIGICTDEELRLFDMFSEEVALYQEEVLNWLELEQSGKHKEAQEYAREVVYPFYLAAAEALTVLADYQYDATRSSVEASTAESHLNSMQIIIICTISSIICFIISIVSTIILLVSYKNDGLQKGRNSIY